LSSDLHLEARIKTLREQQDELLQKNPMLRGLAPLYQDYEAERYYFEVIQFVVTLFLVAVAVCVPLSSNHPTTPFSPSLSYYEQIQHLHLHQTLGVPSHQFWVGRLLG
jgi:hypothetical protein